MIHTWFGFYLSDNVLKVYMGGPGLQSNRFRSLNKINLFLKLKI